MAQQIRLRQRIKSVETIKKITHAMQLISMSNHSRLRHKKITLENYSNQIERLWKLVQGSVKNNRQEEASHKDKNLIIIVSSSKGLLGTFNSRLINFILDDSQINLEKDDVIVVGKQGMQLLKFNNIKTKSEFENFTMNNFDLISKSIAQIIFENEDKYKNFIVYANYPKTFFVQKPSKKVILPLKAEVAQPEEDLFWFESAENIASSLKKLMILSAVQEILFLSLLSEQAARFISMDNATRNATELINQMKIDYNKLRQASITKELTELTAGY